MLIVHAMTCGWMTMDLGAMLEGESGKIRIPVPSYLIRHPKGLVLYDTGLHKSMQTDADARLGVMAPMFDIHYESNEDVAARLEVIDVSVDDITWLVNSHLHFDHCGGNDAIPNAPIVVQRKELEAAKSPDIAGKIGLFSQDWDHGHDFVLADGELDIFSDGSVVCIPTPGHTPGHQSLKLTDESGVKVLTGDACYLRRSIEEMRLPARSFSPEQMLESFKLLKALEAKGATLFYGHDPAFWNDLPEFPKPLAG
jgi:N-acyl homoserine lactone hydrolase